MTVKVAEGVIDTYQGRIVEMLCSGEGDARWLEHEARGAKG